MTRLNFLAHYEASRPNPMADPILSTLPSKAAYHFLNMGRPYEDQPDFDSILEWVLQDFQDATMQDIQNAWELFESEEEAKDFNSIKDAESLYWQTR